uniref:CDC like kinase 4 n=2 Tax=Equus caballus TaxID=9796 RepID=A0A9L0SNL5_HORSE
MRHSKRTHCPDWDSRESWGHESYGGSHKRKRRSHSSTQENRHCKPHHQFKDSDWIIVADLSDWAGVPSLPQCSMCVPLEASHSVEEDTHPR